MGSSPLPVTLPPHTEEHQIPLGEVAVKSLWGCALLLSLTVAPSVAMSAESSPPAPRKVAVYGHRGASALLPEHTLAAYAQAIADGADYIER